MESKLSHQSAIKLINLYRSYPILWDMNHKSYRRNDLKNKAYEEIAKVMGMVAEAVRKKIRSLRITYTSEKRKMAKKSGSAAEDNYVSSLKWFNEMSFLDSSIVIRKTMDNSVENDLNSNSYEEFDNVVYEEHFESNSPKSFQSTPNKRATNNLDKALEKLLDENENEFVAFGTSVAQQLQKVPVDVAYELMGEIQNILTQRKVKCVRESRFPTSNSSSTSSSDIVNVALANAEIDLDTEYDILI